MPSLRTYSDSANWSADWRELPVNSQTEFLPRLRELREYGLPDPQQSVLPAAVVMVLASTPNGLVILLKHRHSTNARNDFETLSLISERLMEEDLAPSLELDDDDERAFDELWISMGKPSEIMLGADVFVRAAQRELYRTCGLDLPASRFVELGSQMVKREDAEVLLGFRLLGVSVEEKR